MSVLCIILSFTGAVDYRLAA